MYAFIHMHGDKIIVQWLVNVNGTALLVRDGNLLRICYPTACTAKIIQLESSEHIKGNHIKHAAVLVIAHSYQQCAISAYCHALHRINMTLVLFDKLNSNQ